MSPRYKGRQAIFIGTPPADWGPSSFWSVPPRLDYVECFQKNLHMWEALGFVRRFNEAERNMPKGARKWAIVSRHLKARRTGEHPQARERRRQLQLQSDSFDTDKVVRLLNACSVTADPAWWQTLIIEVITSGRRVGDVLSDRSWLGNWQEFYAAAGNIFRAADLSKVSFHSLRRFHYQQSQRVVKGGAA